MRQQYARSGSESMLGFLRAMFAVALLSSTSTLNAQTLSCPFDVSTQQPGTRPSVTVDGLLLARYAAPLRDTALTSKVRSGLSLTAVERYMTDNLARYDVDGDGGFTKLDAQIIARHLGGFTGMSLTQGIAFANNAKRKLHTEISAFITAGCPAEVETDPVEVAALAMWRKVQVKGSCSGCHGADYFDLARIGSSDATIMRRAVADGATVDEANALIAAVKKARNEFNIPTTDPLTFRPFQPGGEVLPGARPLDRDYEFGKRLTTVVPMVMTPRTDGLPTVHSLATAKTALNELLAVDMRSLKVGIAYPKWSSDFFNSNEDGTLNDWIADLASEPKDDADRKTWHAIQDAYLRDPSDANFWAMFAGVEKFTTNMMPQTTNAHAFTRHKFKAALIGQHLLRNQMLGRTSFAQGPLAFSYIESGPLRGLFESATYLKRFNYLPGGDMWEIGDAARAQLGQDTLSPPTAPLRDRLVALGMPQFVVDSVRADISWTDAEEEIRVPWFWIGFTFDQTVRRINGSNSTRSAEYMTASLLDAEMYFHQSFGAAKRVAVQGTVAEKLGTSPIYAPHYSYAMAYGRELIKWKTKPTGAHIYDPVFRSEFEAMWSQFVANHLRKDAYLYREALQNGTALRDAAGVAIQAFPTCASLYHFAKYQPQFRAHDEALIYDLAREMKVTLSCGVTYP
jgi:hypothetical protein